MTEQCEFKREAVALVGERRDAGICLRPTAEDGTFVVATAEEEYFDSAGVGECLHYFFHQLGRVNFSLVLGEGCNSHPFLSLWFRCGDRCERGRIGFAVAEKRFEMLLHGESESVEYLAVAGALRNEGEHDLVGAPGQGALARALLVDARNGDAVEPGEEVDDHGADNAVEVGHGVEREVRLQFPVKSDKTSGSPILRRVEVDTAHPEVFGRVEEHCGHRGAGDHEKLHVGVAPCHAVDDRNGHGYVADGGEAGNQHPVRTEKAFAVRTFCCHTAPDWWQGRCTSSSGGRPSCTSFRRQCRRGGGRWLK